MMLIIGSFWAHYDVPVCGTDYASSHFKLTSHPDGGYRLLQGNQCPGYDWHATDRPYEAGEYR